jgi:hypothetical protein
MKNEKKNSSAGIGFTGTLQVAFIVLKLCKVINWSWWWVLAPTWISIIVAVAAIAITLIILHFKDK